MKTQPKSEMRLTDVLQTIDEELTRLRMARDLLTGSSPQETQPARRGPGRPRKYPADGGTQSASQNK